MSIVLQLQEQALLPNTDVPNLLHKCLVVAGKLKHKKFEKWVRLELNGYGDAKTPDYRILRGQFLGKTAYGTKSVQFPWADTQELFSKYEAHQPISEIDELLRRATTTVEIQWADQALLRQQFRTDAIFFVEIPVTQLRRIIDSVKTSIIDWTLKLESEDILGEGLRFSKDEQERAIKDEEKLTPPTIINIIGSISGSMLQQGSPGAEQTS